VTRMHPSSGNESATKGSMNNLSDQLEMIGICISEYFKSLFHCCIFHYISL
jgi:hypothetical protein